MSRAARLDRFARRAYGISGEALLAKLEKGESGGRGNAVSNMGARGWMQFMPGTRQAVLKATGGRVDPYRSRREAREAARMHLLGELGHRKGLGGYNPGGGTQYVRYILGQKVGDVGGGRGAAASGKPSLGRPATPGRTVSGLTTSQVRPHEDIEGALMDSLLSGRKRKGSLFQDITRRLDSGAYASTVTTTDRSGDLKIPGTPGSRASGGIKAGGIKAGGGYMGTKGAIEDLTKLAPGLKLISAKRHNTNPASGTRSDHHHGNKDAYAHDLSDSSRPSPAMDRAAFRIARKLGNRSYKMGQPLVMTKTINGIRYQVLYRTNVGGNHYNHVHVGAKRVG